MWWYMLVIPGLRLMSVSMGYTVLVRNLEEGDQSITRVYLLKTQTSWSLIPVLGKQKQYSQISKAILSSLRLYLIKKKKKKYYNKIATHTHLTLHEVLRHLGPLCSNDAKPSVGQNQIMYILFLRNRLGTSYSLSMVVNLKQVLSPGMFPLFFRAPYCILFCDPVTPGTSSQCFLQQEISPSWP